VYLNAVGLVECFCECSLVLALTAFTMLEKLLPALLLSGWGEVGTESTDCLSVLTNLCCLFATSLCFSSTKDCMALVLRYS